MKLNFICVLILENEPFPTNSKIKMSRIKRSLSIEPNSIVTNIKCEQATCSTDFPAPKRVRHIPLDSRNEVETQIIELENGINNNDINKIIRKTNYIC